MILKNEILQDNFNMDRRSIIIQVNYLSFYKKSCTHGGIAKWKDFPLFTNTYSHFSIGSDGLAKR
jgi:hypothetical protein